MLTKTSAFSRRFRKNSIILQYTNLTISNTKRCNLVIQLNKFCKVFYLWLYFYEL